MLNPNAFLEQLINYMKSLGHNDVYSKRVTGGISVVNVMLNDNFADNNTLKLSTVNADDDYHFNDDEEDENALLHVDDATIAAARKIKL